MKKFALVLLIALLCLPVLAFAACADPADDPYDLSTKEIGYEIPVYPDCEFSYVVKWTERDTYTFEGTEKSCTVKITDMKATLTAKNTISEGDVLEEYFHPYEVTVTVLGQTDTELAGLEVLCYVGGDNSSRNLDYATVGKDGKIKWEKTLGCDYLTGLSFDGLYSYGKFSA